MFKLCAVYTGLCGGGAGGLCANRFGRERSHLISVVSRYVDGVSMYLPVTFSCGHSGLSCPWNHTGLSHLSSCVLVDHVFRTNWSFSSNWGRSGEIGERWPCVCLEGGTHKAWALQACLCISGEAWEDVQSRDYPVLSAESSTVCKKARISPPFSAGHLSEFMKYQVS